jgi:CHASE3 domain sensor protein
MSGTPIDNIQFRRILTRNVALPLGMSVLSAVVFIGIIAYLLNVLNWVEHSQRVIGQASEVSRLSADMEAGMRGYLLSGDEAFLAPYLVAKPKLEVELASLERLVEDNEIQRDRLRRARGAQKQWDQYANEAIERRRKGADVVELVKSGRGKILTDEVRRQFAEVLVAEERLREERNDAARSVTT